MQVVRGYIRAMMLAERKKNNSMKFARPQQRRKIWLGCLFGEKRRRLGSNLIRARKEKRMNLMSKK